MAKKGPGKGPSQRQLRVGELVRHALATVLQRGEAREPMLQREVISVSEVSMSPDLKVATAYVTGLGRPAERQGELVKALAGDADHLRHRMTAHLSHMKSMPALRFRTDTSFDNYAAVDALLSRPQVRADVERAEIGRANAGRADAGGDE